MVEFIKKHLLVLVFSLAGAIGGFLYWKFVGCTSGTCMIKSVWYWSTLYGLLLGYVIGGVVGEVIIKFKKKKI
ncbi:MAG: hypothetical protein C0408_09715 [Odoribacter sp.]|nr:hypothetical protein [Odoribacter sp.]